MGALAVENIASKVTPGEITKEEIKSLIESFADASVRAKEAGFYEVEFMEHMGTYLANFYVLITTEDKMNMVEV